MQERAPELDGLWQGGRLSCREDPDLRQVFA
jgi:hypothetical protein